MLFLYSGCSRVPHLSDRISDNVTVENNVKTATIIYMVIALSFLGNPR